MADNIGVYDISGQVQRVATSSLSVVHSGLSASINERREAQRERYDRLLKGVATKAQAAQSPFDSTPADPPSWTQIYSGKKHAFVISELSSSQHEVTSLNARISGTAKLENTAVSASGTLLYSKQNQLVKLVYKLTAFSASSMGPAAERSPSTIENIIRIGTAAFDQVSGTYRNNSYWNPATFEIDVPDYGKIRDLKVWVEFIHDHRGGTGTGSSDASNIFWAGGDGTGSLGLNHGLQGMQIALRSPNTNFRYAHPLWNDPTVATLEKMPQSTISDTYKRPPELLRNSYLLWAGHAVEEDLGVALGVHTRSLPTDYFLETVATGSVAGILTYPSFTINSLNLPTYCYNNAHEGRIYIMRPYSNGVALVYAKEIVTTTSNAYYTYMVLNKDKITPNILWGENSGFQTKIARSSSAGWAVDTVADAHYNDKHLAIDSNDKILILSTDSNDQLRIYDKIGSAWIGSSILPPHATFCNYNSITCDSNSVFHFAFTYQNTDEQKWEVYYGKSGSFGLFYEKIDSTDLFTETSNGISIAVNSRNEPVIVTGLTTAGAKIFKSSSSGWSSSYVFENIIHSLSYMVSSAAKFDNHDNLYAVLNSIEYRGTSSQGAVLIRSGTDGLSCEVVRDRSLSGIYARIHLDVDSLGIVHILHNFSVAYGAANVYGSLYHLSKSFSTGEEGTHHEFDTDIDMRTVFSDSSKYSNPRHIQDLYSAPNVTSIGSSKLQVERVRQEGSYSSPLSASVKLFNFAYLDTPFYQSSWLTGANFPWMLDGRIPPGNFQGRNWNTSSSLGVPTGWLTGIGNIAGTNEFPTTGSQIGPPDIKPVYPLLDDVYVEKIVYESPTTTLTPFPSGSNKKVVGFRPGLRGTEVHGKWKLLMGNNSGFAGVPSVPVGNPRDGFWFRQFRLEFTIDQGHEASEASFVSRTRKYRRSSNVATQEGKRLVGVVSGSSAWDLGTNAVYVVQNPEYGRSIGITSDKANPTYAVYSKITGSFVAQLSGSGKLSSIESTYLSNEFGTPYIPLSSGSGEPPTSDTYDANEFKNTKRVFDAVFGRNTLIPSDNTLRAHITRENVFMTSRDLAEAAVNTSMSSSNP